MSDRDLISRRGFLNQSAAVGAAAVIAGTAGQASAVAQAPAAQTPSASAETMPMGKIGNVSISRVLLGGNLIGGWLHARDLQYVGSLFRAYATEQKIMQTLALAEKCGINTVFETGAEFVARHNRENRGHMQIIPHIDVNVRQSEQELKDHIKLQIDSGASALYVWGNSADTLMMAGDIKRLGRAVELAKAHGLPVGVGGHSILVAMACEKEKVPCDFYVKTLHSDNYPSATPKAQRKEFMWMTGGPGWYDNMWCINAEETIEFMKTVSKPWIAFKVLAAGAFLPKDGFTYAFKNGADFIAVGMFDFQVRTNCEQARAIVAKCQQRERPWRA
jgi:hypothetical protein